MPLADRALVVGIARYPGIGNLGGPENDATEFHQWVTSPAGGGVDPANARLIVSSSFPAAADPKDERPVLAQIDEFFIEVDEATTKNNAEGNGLRAGPRLWMFFSGHGFAPSLETSGVLMANATFKRIFNCGAASWANRLHEGGWFNDVLLFQDACRNRIAAADITPPFFPAKTASATLLRRRFYAFSSKDQKLSKELTFPDGKVRGVFAATVLEGLRGAARDPTTGAITARTLKTYIQDNMKTRLSDADKNNPEIATEPDVRDFDEFDIVAAPSVAAAVDEYPVNIALPAAGLSVTLQDGTLQPIKTADPAPQIWSLKLPRGLYRVVVAQGGERLFTITGPGTGVAGAIDVRV